MSSNHHLSDQLRMGKKNLIGIFEIFNVNGILSFECHLILPIHNIIIICECAQLFHHFTVFLQVAED